MYLIYLSACQRGSARQCRLGDGRFHRMREGIFTDLPVELQPLGQSRSYFAQLITYVCIVEGPTDRHKVGLYLKQRGLWSHVALKCSNSQLRSLQYGNRSRMSLYRYRNSTESYRLAFGTAQNRTTPQLSRVVEPD
jgi:hypothetical protein